MLKCGATDQTYIITLPNKTDSFLDSDIFRNGEMEEGTTVVNGGASGAPLLMATLPVSSVHMLFI